MALHQIRCPLFPIAEQLFESLHVAGFVMPAQQLRRCRRRACARVEQRDVYFAARECLIQHGQVAYDESQKAYADSGFEHRHKSSARSARRHIAKTEREEGAAAKVEARSK